MRVTQIQFNSVYSGLNSTKIIPFFNGDCDSFPLYLNFLGILITYNCLIPFQGLSRMDLDLKSWKKVGYNWIFVVFCRQRRCVRVASEWTAAPFPAWGTQPKVKFLKNLEKGWNYWDFCENPWKIRFLLQKSMENSIIFLQKYMENPGFFLQKFTENSHFLGIFLFFLEYFSMSANIFNFLGLFLIFWEHFSFSGNFPHFQGIFLNFWEFFSISGNKNPKKNPGKKKFQISPFSSSPSLPMRKIPFSRLFLGISSPGSTWFKFSLFFQEFIFPNIPTASTPGRGTTENQDLLSSASSSR